MPLSAMKANHVQGCVSKSIHNPTDQGMPLFHSVWHLLVCTRRTEPSYGLLQFKRGTERLERVRWKATESVKCGELAAGSKTEGTGCVQPGEEKARLGLIVVFQH